MNKVAFILLIVLGILSCNKKPQISSLDPVNWDNRVVASALSDSLIKGTTYLSVYSQIYSQTQQRTHDLAATISMRNTNRMDTIFLDKAEYFNTKGESIRTYFDKTIFIAPMETVEIVIDEQDQEGGTGANFLFTWQVLPNSNKPLFEGIMISTTGQQGISFTTQGVSIE